MEPGFSEFSYGYAITEEFASGRWGRIYGYPVFQSTYREGKVGGHDVQIPFAIPLFLQFKLSDYLFRRNARDWGLFNQQYYRMYLRRLRSSQQHNMLMDLENKGNEVYYAAPEFHTTVELNEAYVNRNVVNRSAFFSPLDIGGLPDLDEHYIVFTPTSLVFYFRSEETRKLKRILGKNFVYNLELILKQKQRKVDGVFFDDISAQLIDLLDRSWKSWEQMSFLRFELLDKGESLRGKALFAAYLTRTFLDAELFLVGMRED